MKNSIDDIAKSFLTEAKASPRMLEDLAAMERYMAESYTGRAFVELLQNADDADAKHIVIYSVDDCIIFANDGRSFDENDIVSICRSGASSKERGDGIGYRGIGFKSTTYLSTEIIIHSSDTYFTFSKKRCSKALGLPIDSVPTVRVPFHVDDTEIKNSVKTSIKIHESQGFNTFFIFVEGNMAKLVSELNGINHGWMLFLNKVERIEIVLSTMRAKYEVTRKHTTINQVIVSCIGKKEQWLIVSDNHNNDIAFRYDPKSGITACDTQDAVFHCYLPTMDLMAFPFKVNSDFSTDPSRKHIIFDDITKNSLKLICELLAQFVSENIMNEKITPVVDLLCSRSGLSELSMQFENTIFSILSKTEWIPLSNDKLVLPKMCILPPDWFDKKSKEIIEDNTPALRERSVRKMNIKDIERFYQLIQRLGGILYSKNEYFTILRNIDTMIKLNNQFSGKLFSYAYRAAMYSPEIIGEVFVPTPDKTLVSLQELKVSIKLDDLFISGLKLILKDEEIARLIDQFPVLGECLNTTVMPVAPKAMQKPLPKLAYSKWKTPTQNCVVAMTLKGMSSKDVSKQNNGYDVISSDTTEKTIYVAVKGVKTIGDTFVLTDKEHDIANNLGELYYIFIITFDQPEKNVLIPFSDIVKSEKRIKDWEWICTEYIYSTDDYLQSDLNMLNSKFISQFSLAYLNQNQKTLLTSLISDDSCNTVSFSRDDIILAKQINSISNFYIGKPVLSIDDECLAIVPDLFHSVKYMLTI